MKKYDTQLVDSWTNADIVNHDLVLLTHFVSKTNAKDALEVWLNENKFDRPFAIVSFMYTENAQLLFVLSLEYGKVSDPIHNEELRKVKKIPASILTSLFKDFKFYDTKPPLIYIMELIYDQVLPPLIEGDKKNYIIEMSAEDMRNLMQDLYLPNSINKQLGQIPKLEWVKEALNKFVEVGFAKIRDSKGKRNYIIQLRTTTKTDTRVLLAKKLFDQEKKKIKTAPEQQTLFAEE
jgi:hypothetical protein